MIDSQRVLSLTLRIDWSDLDTYEHVNNISIMRYLQSARVQFWEKTGWVDSYKKHRIGHILVSTKCDFRKELFYPGTVVIETAVSFMKNSSFGIHHQLFDEQNQVCAESNDVALCYDFNVKKSIRITKELREVMELYQQV